MTIGLHEMRMSVRKRMDELRPNEAGFECVDADSIDLDRVIDGCLVEAVSYVHANAPAHRIGNDSLLLASSLVSCKEGSDVVEIRIPNLLRFVSLKSKDSDIVVTGWHEEGETVARMQGNPYVKGTFQRPVLVRLSSASGHGEAALKYFSLKEPVSDKKEGDMPFEFVRYLPMPEIDKAGDCIEICPLLKEAVFNYLTGLVLNIYGDGRAENFFKLCKEMM